MSHAHGTNEQVALDIKVTRVALILPPDKYTLLYVALLIFQVIVLF